MYFITNRHIRKSGQAWRFAKTNEVSPSLSYCRLPDTGKKFELLKSEDFMADIRDNPSRELLLYIHGFNNQPFKDIFPRAQGLARQLAQAGLGQIEVLPLIWPCDDGYRIIQNYWDDQDAAEQSGPHFARAISKLMAWQEQNADSDRQCLMRMHMLAHSMGGRMLTFALHFWAHRFGGGGVPYLFRNVFLMAADIPNESLESGEPGHFIPKAGQNVFCYFANDDLAMPASKVSNVRNGVFTRRLGHTGPEDMDRVPKRVISVNCDAFNNRIDAPKGHSYFLDKGTDKSPAFAHMAEVLGRQFDPTRREVVLPKRV